MIKTILNIVSWLFILCYLILTLGFVAEKQNETPCDSLDIRIIDTTGNKFVDNEDIKATFSNKKINILGKPFNKLNLAQLEAIIYQNNAVKRVEIYKNLGILTIEIEQKNPILRIINAYNQSYYIDINGGVMPFSKKYSARIIVANGNIKSLYYNKRISKDLLTVSTEDSIKYVDITSKLYTLSKYINNNKFWKAQIEQIYVDENNEFILIPKVGSHLILLGDINNLDGKFRNLKVFYEEKMKVVGWNKYSTINLKYKNQIVCTKNSLYDTKK